MVQYGTSSAPAEGVKHVEFESQWFFDAGEDSTTLLSYLVPFGSGHRHHGEEGSDNDSSRLQERPFCYLGRGEETIL